MSDPFSPFPDDPPIHVGDPQDNHLGNQRAAINNPDVIYHDEAQSKRHQGRSIDRHSRRHGRRSQGNSHDFSYRAWTASYASPPTILRFTNVNASTDQSARLVSMIVMIIVDLVSKLLQLL